MMTSIIEKILDITNNQKLDTFRLVLMCIGLGYVLPIRNRTLRNTLQTINVNGKTTHFNSYDDRGFLYRSNYCERFFEAQYTEIDASGPYSTKKSNLLVNDDLIRICYYYGRISIVYKNENGNWYEFADHGNNRPTPTEIDMNKRSFHILYDTYNKIIGLTDDSSRLHIKIEYDKRGNISHVYHRNLEEPVCIEGYVLKYDDKNNLISLKCNRQRTNYRYNKRGLVRFSCKKERGKQTVIAYQYDKTGRPKTKKVTDETGTRTYQYSYTTNITTLY